MNLCPFCMRQVQDAQCPHCGNPVSYSGDPMHLQAGYVLHGKHPYILGAALGQGGFGITYIALDMETNQRVAIKEYFPTYCAGRVDKVSVAPYRGQEEVFRKGRERFLDEARVLKSLSDLKSIVNVLDFFETNHSAYLVMEFLEGDSLKSHAQKHGKFPAQSFLQQLRPLMEDIERMHQRGVVHRDIAPDNIILTPDGQLKLIDFGAARSYVGDKSMTVVVKKGFAPIEQYMRHGSNAATDVYALAATIYYCITGIVPPDSAERQIDNAPIGPPSTLGVDIMLQQEKALIKALEINPQNRTQNILEFMSQLYVQDHSSKPFAPQPAVLAIEPEPIIPANNIELQENTSKVIEVEFLQEEIRMDTEFCKETEESPKERNKISEKNIRKIYKIVIIGMLVCFALFIIMKNAQHGFQTLNEDDLSFTCSEDEFTYLKDNGDFGFANYNILDNPIKNCKQMTIELDILDLGEGNVRNWAFYLRTLDGYWVESKRFSLEEGKARQTITFENPISFNAYTAVCLSLGNDWDFDFNVKISDAQIDYISKYEECNHQFSKATCTDPKTCVICKMKVGIPLGHDYSEPTCTNAAQCTRCFVKSGSNLAHDWIPATYDSPKTCKYCGKTTGQVKGYHEYLKGKWKSKQVSIGGTNTHPWVFEETVTNCTKFTMHFQITTVKYGNVYGKYTLYYKDTKGKWKKIGTFEVPDQSKIVKTFELDSPVSFTQLAVVAPPRIQFSYSYNLSFRDWYLRD